MLDGVAPVYPLVVAIETFGVHVVAEAECCKGLVVKDVEALTGVFAGGAVVEGDGDERLGREMPAHSDVSIAVLL